MDSPTRREPTSPGPLVYGNAFDRVEGDPRSLEGFQDDGNDHLDMPAGRDLGDDAAVLLMDPDL